MMFMFGENEYVAGKVVNIHSTLGTRRYNKDCD